MYGIIILIYKGKKLPYLCVKKIWHDGGGDAKKRKIYLIILCYRGYG
jgi:hypothetical protein